MSLCDDKPVYEKLMQKASVRSAVTFLAKEVGYVEDDKKAPYQVLNLISAAQKRGIFTDGEEVSNVSKRHGDSPPPSSNDKKEKSKPKKGEKKETPAQPEKKTHLPAGLEQIEKAFRTKFDAILKDDPNYFQPGKELKEVWSKWKKANPEGKLSAVDYAYLNDPALFLRWSKMVDRFSKEHRELAFATMAQVKSKNLDDLEPSNLLFKPKASARYEEAKDAPENIDFPSAWNGENLSYEPIRAPLKDKPEEKPTDEAKEDQAPPSEKEPKTGSGKPKRDKPSKGSKKKPDDSRILSGAKPPPGFPDSFNDQ